MWYSNSYNCIKNRLIPWFRERRPPWGRSWSCWLCTSCRIRTLFQLVCPCRAGILPFGWSTHKDKRRGKDARILLRCCSSAPSKWSTGNPFRWSCTTFYWPWSLKCWRRGWKLIGRCHAEATCPPPGWCSSLWSSLWSFLGYGSFRILCSRGSRRWSRQRRLLLSPPLWSLPRRG